MDILKVEMEKPATEMEKSKRKGGWCSYERTGRYDAIFWKISSVFLLPATPPT